MLVRDRVISDSLHELRNRKKRRGKCLGMQWGPTLEEPDKLPKGLSGVSNYQPGKELGLITYSKDRRRTFGFIIKNINSADFIVIVIIVLLYPIIM